jgi:hypothetical protein
MNTFQCERLYHLLPAIYRQRDVAQGEPLRALLALIEDDLQRLEADIDGLYENWSIETCDEWVVPYIGDLLGIRGLGSSTSQIVSQRAYVANAIRYRRRKGVPRIVERVGRDMTGWHIRVVEYFTRLGITQHLHNVRPGQGTTVDVRHRAALAALGTPFETIAARPNVRRITTRSGRHNIANIGLFIWRLQSFPLTRATAQQITPGCYTFSPLGTDIPLFNRPQPQATLDTPTEAWHLPIPLTRQAFADDLRQPTSRYYGPDRSVYVRQDAQAVPSTRIVSQDLRDWRRPAGGTVAVDVERGRLAFAEGEEPQAQVEVTYNYGFSAAIGGGPYDRRSTLTEPQQTTWHIDVGQGRALASLAEALTQWQMHCSTTPQPRGLIRIVDNGIYNISPTVVVPAGGILAIEAVDGVCPVIRSSEELHVSLQSTRDSAGTLGATLLLNGLWLDAQRGITLMSSDPSLTGYALQPEFSPTSGALTLVVRHCTAMSGLRSVSEAVDVQVVIDHSLVGPLQLPGDSVGLTVQDSVLDGASGPAIAAPDATDPFGPPTTLERVTVFGPAYMRELRVASEVICTAPVQVQRLQTGMVRFSYIPDGSQTPRRYRCQPDLAVATDAVNGQEARRATLQPQFTSTRYGDPGYAQLSPQCPREISTGAESGTEMGALHDLLQAQREAHLRALLDEYLPSGLEAGIFYVT